MLTFFQLIRTWPWSTSCRAWAREELAACRPDARFLSTIVRYWPAGTIFVCVVDPGVGTERNIVALESEGRVFLAVDNLGDRTYAGSVIVNEANRRYYEPAPGRGVTVGVEWHWR